jgi:hypothetical protein
LPHVLDVLGKYNGLVSQVRSGLRVFFPWTANTHPSDLNQMFSRKLKTKLTILVFC